MKLHKRILRSPATLAVAKLVLRGYRTAVYGGFLWRHDPGLTRLLRSDEPVIFLAWHQDFVHTLGYISRWNPARRTYALASASRDGGVATAAAECVGFRPPVRGSTSRGGAGALLRLRRLLEHEPDASLVVVCDGPRPPARVLKPGGLHLAQATGRPLWLLRTSFARRKVLRRTWAQFHLPAPWSRGVVLADGPIEVPRHLDRPAFERLREDVEARLNALADRADALVGN